MADTWVTFAAALGGALTGGVASSIGSMFVHRRQETRGQRRELYTTHVPSLITTLEGCVLSNEQQAFWLAGEIIDELENGVTVRTAVLASKRDVRKVREIRGELTAASDLEAQLEESGSWDQRDPAYQAAVEKEKPVADAALDTAQLYEGWLRDKLG